MRRFKTIWLTSSITAVYMMLIVGASAKAGIVTSDTPIDPEETVTADLANAEQLLTEAKAKVTSIPQLIKSSQFLVSFLDSSAHPDQAIKRVKEYIKAAEARRKEVAAAAPMSLEDYLEAEREKKGLPKKPESMSDLAERSVAHMGDELYRLNLDIESAYNRLHQLEKLDPDTINKAIADEKPFTDKIEAYKSEFKDLPTKIEMLTASVEAIKAEKAVIHNQKIVAYYEVAVLQNQVADLKNQLTDARNSGAAAEKRATTAEAELAALRAQHGNVTNDARADLGVGITQFNNTPFYFIRNNSTSQSISGVLSTRLVTGTFTTKFKLDAGEIWYIVSTQSVVGLPPAVASAKYDK